jgi:NADPH:quinone reductase-like Zn-dependent oxidoreductase
VRAIVLEKFGGVDGLQVREIEDPVPTAGEAVVRVKACGLNRLDLWIRSGTLARRPTLPHVMGSEVAGVVEAVGPGVSGMTQGDPVVVAPYLFCGRCEFCLEGQETVCLRSDILGLNSQGGYAELVKVPASNLMPLPAGVTFEEAAALTLAAPTAWRMLTERVRIMPGQWVLVQAAGSGVGSAAIQFAKLFGARVIATAGSEAKLEKARELGADEVINYTSSDVVQEVRRITGKRGVDLAVEHVGAATWEQSLACLARRGRIVTCGATTGSDAGINLWTLFAKENTVIGSYGASRAEVAKVLSLAASGRVRAVLDTVFNYDEVARAHERLESRQQFGKIVLRF